MQEETNDFQCKVSNLEEIDRNPETIEAKFRCPANMVYFAYIPNLILILFESG
jgi:hypothetical protein